ncbi:MAG: ABC transporter substrate-binding protein, partial [Candidatus Rokuibacteriota bacterium]
MPAPMFGRVAAVLAPLVTFLVTFFVAPPLSTSPALSQSVAPPTQVVRRELRIGAPGVPATLEPGAALEGASPLIARQVFDTLVAWREGSTEIESALATRWHASRDGLVWSFTLREGVKFHDGSPLTGLEVAASFERQLKPEAQGANRSWPALLRGAPGVIKEVRAPTARTVEIALFQPYAPLLTVLAHPGLAIAKPSTAADGAGRLIGTGPYRVVDASVGRLALEAMPGHWAGSPKSERIVFLDVSTDDQAEPELDSRSLDVWFPTAPPRRTEGTLSAPGLRIGYLAFQTEKEPFSRRTLRQAVAAAIDPAILGQVLGRAAVPLQSFLPPGVWARREGSPILGGGRAAVKALIKESRWPKDAKPTLLVPAETTPLNLPKLAETIQLLLGSDDLP